MRHPTYLSCWEEVELAQLSREKNAETLNASQTDNKLTVDLFSAKECLRFEMTRRVESAWRGEDAVVSAWLQPDGNLLLAPCSSARNILLAPCSSASAFIDASSNDISTNFFSSSATRSSFDARRFLNAQRMVSSIESTTIGTIPRFFGRR